MWHVDVSLPFALDYQQASVSKNMVVLNQATVAEVLPPGKYDIHYHRKQGVLLYHGVRQSYKAEMRVIGNTRHILHAPTPCTREGEPYFMILAGKGAQYEKFGSGPWVTCRSFEEAKNHVELAGFPSFVILGEFQPDSPDSAGDFVKWMFEEDERQPWMVAVPALRVPGSDEHRTRIIRIIQECENQREMRQW